MLTVRKIMRFCKRIVFRNRSRAARRPRRAHHRRTSGPSWQHRSNLGGCNRQCRLPLVSGSASSGVPSDALPGRVSVFPEVRSADQTNHPSGSWDDWRL